MKATIKLHKSATTKKGHPILIYLSDNYSDKRIRIGHHAKISEWNDKLAEPKKSHPDFFNLHRKIQELKTKLSEINYKCNSINEALEVLDRKKGGNTFFEICSKGLYKLDTKYSALNSFHSHHPAILPNEISAEMVRNYINKELKIRKPGGVDSYIRSLKALWNANFKEENPFKVPVKVPRTIKAIVSDEEIRLLKEVELKGKANDYRNYFLLQFYLGGIDFEVLSRLRKKDIKNGRIEFNRDKGNSDTFCSNKVFDCARELFWEGEYLIDAHKYSYREFRSNYSRRFKLVCRDLGITEIKSKTARYTFINRGKNLLIDQRIVGQIVGHVFSSTTGLYENDFPLNIQDEAHYRIITL